MGNDKVVSLAAPAVVEDALTELLRTGARRLIEAAMSALLFAATGRRATTSQVVATQSASISQPMNEHPNSRATTAVVPPPTKGSQTNMPGPANLPSKSRNAPSSTKAGSSTIGGFPRFEIRGSHIDTAQSCQTSAAILVDQITDEYLGLADLLMKYSGPVLRSSDDFILFVSIALKHANSQRLRAQPTVESHARSLRPSQRLRLPIANTRAPTGGALRIERRKFANTTRLTAKQLRELRHESRSDDERD